MLLVFSMQNTTKFTQEMGLRLTVKLPSNHVNMVYNCGFVNVPIIEKKRKKQNDCQINVCFMSLIDVAVWERKGYQGLEYLRQSGHSATIFQC